MKTWMPPTLAVIPKSQNKYREQISNEEMKKVQKWASLKFIKNPIEVTSAESLM